MGGKFEEKVLVDNAAALYAQMNLLDSHFYPCVHYKQLGDMKGELRWCMLVCDELHT